MNLAKIWGCQNSDSIVHWVTWYDPHAWRPFERNQKRGSKQINHWFSLQNPFLFCFVLCGVFFSFGLMEWFRNKIFPSKDYFRKWKLAIYPLKSGRNSNVFISTGNEFWHAGGRECWRYKNNHLLPNRRGRNQVGHIPHRGNSSSLLASYGIEGRRKAGSREVEKKEIWAVFLAVLHVEKAGLDWRNCKTGRLTIKAYLSKAHLNS